jgi:hypothetical protein
MNQDEGQSRKEILTLYIFLAFAFAFAFTLFAGAVDIGTFELAAAVATLMNTASVRRSNLICILL